MKPGAPTVLLFLLSLVLAILGLIGRLRPELIAPELAANSFWLLAGAYGVLTLGALYRGQ